MNSFVFDGRLVRDPETEVIPNGMECVKFTVANERRKGKDDRQSSFISCRAFGKTGAFVAQYFKKGQPIGVSGEVEIKAYEDKSGVKRSATTIFVDKVWFTLGSGKNAEKVSSDQFEDVNTDNLPFLL